METEPPNTLNLPYQPLEKIPVVKLRKEDARGGVKAEEGEGATLTMAGVGLGCSATALCKLVCTRCKKADV